MYLRTCGFLQGAAAAVLCLIQNYKSFLVKLHPQVVFIVVVLILSIRIIKSVVTEQAPVTIWIGGIPQENKNINKRGTGIHHC